MEKKKFVPALGSIIPVALPNEVVRATVRKVVSDDSLIVRIDVTPPMGKSHAYHFNDYVAVTREKHPLSGEEWVSQDERQLAMREAVGAAE